MCSSQISSCQGMKAEAERKRGRLGRDGGVRQARADGRSHEQVGTAHGLVAVDLRRGDAEAIELIVEEPAGFRAALAVRDAQTAGDDVPEILHLAAVCGRHGQSLSPGGETDRLDAGPGPRYGCRLHGGRQPRGWRRLRGNPRAPSCCRTATTTSSSGGRWRDKGPWRRASAGSQPGDGERGLAARDASGQDGALIVTARFAPRQRPACPERFSSVVLAVLVVLAGLSHHAERRDEAGQEGAISARAGRRSCRHRRH